MKFPESVFDSLTFQDNVKVSIQKNHENNGVATSLAEIVDDKKRRSTWLVMNPDKYSWYIIERYYWKLNEKAIPFEEEKDKLYWLKNDLYHLHFEDEEILRYSTAWLNDHIMDAAQNLICKELGADDDYKSLLNVRKCRGAPYCVVKNGHM